MIMHDPEFSQDRKWFFASLKEMAVDYADLKIQLEIAGLPKPSAAGHVYRSDLVAALSSGKRGQALIDTLQQPDPYIASLLAHPGPECREAA